MNRRRLLSTVAALGTAAGAGCATLSGSGSGSNGRSGDVDTWLAWGHKDGRTDDFFFEHRRYDRLYDDVSTVASDGIAHFQRQPLPEDARELDLARLDGWVSYGHPTLAAGHVIAATGSFEAEELVDPLRAGPHELVGQHASFDIVRHREGGYVAVDDGRVLWSIDDRSPVERQVFTETLSSVLTTRAGDRSGLRSRSSLLDLLLDRAPDGHVLHAWSYVGDQSENSHPELTGVYGVAQIMRFDAESGRHVWLFVYPTAEQVDRTAVVAWANEIPADADPALSVTVDGRVATVSYTGPWRTLP